MTREELLQSAKPILFNTEMVRAILDGRKAVTRRVVKNLPEDAEFGGWLLDSTCQEDAKDIEKAGFKTLKRQTEKAGCIFVKPPCVERDILWVRETWQHLYELDGNEQIIEGTEKYYYAASDIIPFDTYVDTMGRTHQKVPWRPSIHMPKEAARIFLRVKDVRVERLQDMSENDAIKEGVTAEPVLEGGEELPALYWFPQLWNSTIKKADLEQYGWEASPWVWVIEFERVEVDE